MQFEVIIFVGGVDGCELRRRRHRAGAHAEQALVRRGQVLVDDSEPPLAHASEPHAAYRAGEFSQFVALAPRAAGSADAGACPPWRRFTPREVARLQGFPDGFELGEKDEASYSGVGNAVSVPVVAAIARAVVEAVAESTT